MKVSLTRTYRSPKGNPVFVYKVDGKAADLDSFRLAQGKYYREDDQGSPLWFTTRCIGNQGTLIITKNNKVVPDMSAFDQAASIASQYGGDFGQELAKATVNQILGQGSPAPSASEDAPEAEQAPADDDDAEA